MRALIDLSNALDRLVIRVGKVAAWAGLGLILVTMFDVATRNFSQSSWQALRDLVALQQDWFGSTKLQELEWHLHTILFAMCLGFAYVKGGHVRIDIVRESLPPRVQWWIELLGTVLFLLPYCALVVWFSADFVERSFMQNEVSSSATGLTHRWIIKAFLPVGFAFLALSGVTALLRRIVLLFGPPEMRLRAEITPD